MEASTAAEKMGTLDRSQRAQVTLEFKLQHKE
jgi:hypothetical protein